MKIWHYVAIGLLVYGVALLIQAPASLADKWLAQSTNGELRLTNVHGTLWHGAARLGAMDFGWRMQPGYLLLGQMRVVLNRPQIAQPMHIIASTNQVILDHVDIWLPLAPLIDRSDARMKSLGLAGQLHCQTEHLTLADGMTGSASVDWIDAQSALSRVVPLGSYHFAVQGAASQINVQLTTLQGPLFLQGNGNWERSSGFRLSGYAQAKPKALQGLLAIIGNPASNGRYRFSLPSAVSR